MDALRWIILTLSFASLLAAALYAGRYPTSRWILIAPITVVVHITIYHTARLLQIPIPNALLNFWSATIHLHVVFLVLMGFVIFRNYRIVLFRGDE